MLTWHAFRQQHKLKYGSVNKKQLSRDYLVYKLQHAKVEMYYKPVCIYCQKAKALLKQLRVRYTTMNVENHKALQEMLVRSQRKTVPQIFINNRHLGGYSELAALLK